MCGVFGGVGASIDEAYKCLQNIRRGNDGITVRQYGEVVLGSRRHLVKESHKASVNQGESDQPYVSPDGKARLVFNGELFNFAEIRKDLQAAGSSFLTDGDTEVFLKLYEQQGKDFVKHRKMDAMFAFGIHDENTNALIVARDWPGRLPLFYYYHRERRIFLFSSELKGFRPLGWLSLGDPVELTPGHQMVLNLETFELKIEAYYQPTPRRENVPLWEVGGELHRLLKESARNRTMGDVPICTMLSGGIDSLMTTYYVLSSIDFARADYRPTSYVFAIDDYDSEDVRRARIAARGFEEIGLTLNEIRVPREQVIDDLPDIVDMFEMRRIKALSVYPLPIYYYLAPRMYQDGFKVTIGGHGVDELLGAYDAWKELRAPHHVQTQLRSRLLFMSMIYENMLRRASIIFMNRGPIEARFPFLQPAVCEYALGIDTKWLAMDPANAQLMLKLIDTKAGPRSGWMNETKEFYDYLVRYLDNGGKHPEGTSEHTVTEIEKLFWKFPLIVAGMHACEESYLPFHCLLFPKLRGQHGSGLTSLEPLVVKRYGAFGATDQEVFKQFVHQSFGC